MSHKNNDKRELRELKRDLKRLGNKHVRRQVKQCLENDPDEVLNLETDYGTYGTSELNGLDRITK